MPCNDSVFAKRGYVKQKRSSLRHGDTVLAKRGYMKQKRSSLRHGDTHFETEKTAFWSPNGTGVSLVNTISLKAFMKRKEFNPI